ncbi:hypothetical protein QBC41DRAFT_226608 [Cercophora samala]|uniref:Uncharacterized protein n=1 Tax=Cercophora samala TaxID=330535 RepID=A0AA39ZC45_9PEZI|nr:hypothetical protein QBC41DRAFT_226608 [Cercophora samala]
MIPRQSGPLSANRLVVDVSRRTPPGIRFTPSVGSDRIFQAPKNTPPNVTVTSPEQGPLLRVGGGPSFGPKISSLAPATASIATFSGSLNVHSSYRHITPVLTPVQQITVPYQTFVGLHQR